MWTQVEEKDKEREDTEETTTTDTEKKKKEEQLCRRQQGGCFSFSWMRNRRKREKGRQRKINNIFPTHFKGC